MLERVPFGENGKCVGAGASDVRISLDLDLLHCFLAQILVYLLSLHLWVVDGELGPLGEKRVAHVDGGRLACVSGIFLKSKAEDGYLLARDGVEHGTNHIRSESLLLPIVHHNHLVPVFGHLREAKRTAEIDEIEDIFLKAGAAKANGSLEKLGPDARVDADSVRDLCDVGSRRLAERGD